MKSDAESLETALSGLQRQIASSAFRDVAKAFEAELRGARVTKEERDDLWQHYQALWDKHKSTVAERSVSAKRNYLEELSSLDYSYDGAPLGQNFSNWERVGDKIRAARARIKSIRATVKADPDLLFPDRKAVYEEIDSVWFKIGQSHDMAQDFHRKEADRLYNEAERAVEDLRPHDATAVFKASQAALKSLFLRTNDRATYRSLFDNLWEKIKLKKEESKKRYEDWRERQGRGLETLRGAHTKALGALQRVRDNIQKNFDSLAEGGSASYRERLKEWISEGESKANDIERSIAELEAKIRDAETRLDDD